MKKVLTIALGLMIMAMSSVALAATTNDNLKSAITGEYGASTKYAAFSKAAADAGYPSLAKLFAATSKAESFHVSSHQKVLGQNWLPEKPVVKAGTMAENLQAGIDGETYEFTKMYPGFIEQANKDCNTAAVKSFKNASAAEQNHAELYKAELKNVASLKGVDADWYLCPKCGLVSKDGAPDTCPICKVSGKTFMKNPTL